MSFRERFETIGSRWGNSLTTHSASQFDFLLRIFCKALSENFTT